MWVNTLIAMGKNYIVSGMWITFYSWGWFIYTDPVDCQTALYDKKGQLLYLHYGDVIMGVMASQITSLTIVYSNVDSVADRRKHQSFASLAFVRGIHRWPVNSPHKGPVTRKMFPFDDVIMNSLAPTICGCSFRSVIFKPILEIEIANPCREIKVISMPQSPIGGKSTLVQVMAWCLRTTSHRLNQCWTRSISPYGVNRP